MTQVPSRIGVYVCHCGINIASTVDVEKVVEEASRMEGVVVAKNYTYLCSEPGQALMKKDAKELGLTKIVVCSCSPRMHENTFRRALAEVGINPYCFEMANIREQCSWVHEDRDSATEKAIALTRSAVAKGNLLSPLEEQEVDVIPRTLVIGGGIAGMQAALDIADAGFEVVLVERDPSIGGHMAQLDKTFPTLDCSACILTPRMVEVAEHPGIRLYTHSEVENITGYIGNFEIDIRKKARYVDEEKCTSCGDCMTACPVRNVPEIQPVHDYSAETEPEERRRLDAILARFSSSPPAKEMLIQILQSINDEYNYLPEYALKYLSQKIEVPLSQVYHAATFYTAFSLEPRGKHVIKVCMGTACHTRGALRVLEELERRLEVEAGGTTEDLFFTLETVNCLGCCALAPVVVVDEDYHASMVPSRVEKMLAMYRNLES